MPPHTNLFDNLKKNHTNSQEEKITHIQKRVDNDDDITVYQHQNQTPTITQANAYSSVSLSNANISNITNSASLPTPLPLLSSSTFNFSSLLENSNNNNNNNSSVPDFFDTSSQESSIKDIQANSVAEERDYLENCIEQMENVNEIGYEISLLDNIFDPIDLQHNASTTTTNPHQKYALSSGHVSSYNNNETQSSVNFNIYNNNYNNHHHHHQMTSSSINFNQIEIKQEKHDLDADFPLAMTNSVIPKTKTIRKNGKLVNEKHYGPIVVRPRKNPAPTLASGRKSKYAQLTTDEEYRREIRRRRNRLAAEKCKLKRNEIEEKLEMDLVNLNNEYHAINRENEMLLAKKMRLEKLLNEHIQTCISGTSSSSTNNTTNTNNNSSSSNITNIVIANIDYQANTQINYSLNPSSQLNNAQTYFGGNNDSFTANPNTNTSIYSNANGGGYAQSTIYDLNSLQQQQQHPIQSFQTNANTLQNNFVGNQQMFTRQNSHFQYNNQYNRYV
jgi:hypothetical protein